MSDPKQFLIYGDLNVVQGTGDISSGDGSVYITSALDVNGITTLDKTTVDTSDGFFSVVGTNKVSFTPTSAPIELIGGASSIFNTTVGSLTLASTAGEVIVNSGTLFDVNATTGITMDSNASSHFIVAGGSELTLKSNDGRVIMESGSSQSNALTLLASNAAGGVAISAGTFGVNLTSTDGPFSINGQSASNITVATDEPAQDLTLRVSGNTNSSIILTSSGTGSDAIRLDTTGLAGGIDINSTSGAITLDSVLESNFTVSGAFDLKLGSTLGSTVVSGGEAVVDAVSISAPNGGVAISSGALGATIDTTGSFSIDGAAASNVTVTGTGALTVSNTGGQLLLQSSKASADAVRIHANNGLGGIDIDAGTAGISVSSQGTVALNANGAPSNLSLTASGNDQDLTIALLGVYDSSIIISSDGNSTDAIKIGTTAGGIDINSFGRITIDTENIGDGIKIGTEFTVPVTIGTISSITTIAGDLVVSGTSTTINTQTLTVEDNVIAINSGMGELGADGGILIRRYQTANNDGSGDVVQDTGTGTISGTFQAGSALPGTLVLGTGASAVDDFYNGFWIKFTVEAITYVRRVKSYIGSTKVATIYVTGESDGLDLVTPPTTEAYNLYNSPYISTFYKESNDRWNIAYTAMTPAPIADAGTSMFSIQRYAPMDVGAITIKSNGIPGGSVLNVNVINETTADTGVTIEGVLLKDGLIGGSAPDTTEVVTLLDNSIAGVNIQGTSSSGSYMILVTAIDASNLNKRPLGAHATFIASSSGNGGGNTRLSASQGASGERIDITWLSGENIKLRHSPAFSGGTGVNVSYRVKVVKVI